MKFTYDFDIDDWDSFQKYHYSVSPEYRRLRNITAILFPAVALLTIIWHYIKHGFDALHISIFVGLSIAWFLLYPRWLDHNHIRNNKHFLLKGKTNKMLGRRDVEFFSDRIHIKTSSGETTLPASAIRNLIEAPDGLVLCVSSTKAFIIPKRKLSEEEFREAVAFARQHYGMQDGQP